MTGKFSTMCMVVIAAAGIAAVNAAEPLTPVQLQKVRHDHYEQLGKNFKKLRDQMTAGSPDFALLLAAAEAINEASINQGQWFPHGTGPEAGKTRALPEIWKKPAEFLEAQKLLSERAPKLLAAAQSKDLGAIKAAFKEVGGACKNCHDNFRSPDEDH